MRGYPTNYPRVTEIVGRISIQFRTEQLFGARRNRNLAIQGCFRCLMQPKVGGSRAVSGSNRDGSATSVRNWALQNLPFLRLWQRPACARARFSIP